MVIGWRVLVGGSRRLSVLNQGVDGEGGDGAGDPEQRVLLRSLLRFRGIYPPRKTLCWRPLLQGYVCAIVRYLWVVCGTGCVSWSFAGEDVLVEVTYAVDRDRPIIGGTVSPGVRLKQSLPAHIRDDADWIA